MKNEVDDLLIFGWVEANPVNFYIYIFIFWSEKSNISALSTFFLEIAETRQNAKKWLKSAITAAFFTIFWLFQA